MTTTPSVKKRRYVYNPLKEEKVAAAREDLEHLLIPSLLEMLARLPRFDPELDPSVPQGETDLCRETNKAWVGVFTLAKRAKADDLLELVYRHPQWKNREQLRSRTDAYRKYQRAKAKLQALARTDEERLQRAEKAKAKYQQDAAASWWSPERQVHLAQRVLRGDPQAHKVSGPVGRLLKKRFPDDWDRKAAKVEVWIAVLKYDGSPEAEQEIFKACNWACVKPMFPMVLAEAKKRLQARLAVSQDPTADEITELLEAV